MLKIEILAKDNLPGRLSDVITQITKDETRLNSSTRRFLVQGRSDVIFGIDTRE